MTRHRIPGWAWLVALAAGVMVLAAACGGSDSKGSVNQIQMGRPAPAPDAKDIPTSYAPKPGDLLFYTNGSISYNSTAKHPWIVVIDAKTKKIAAASEISEVSSSPHGLGASPDGSKLYLPAGIGQPIPALGSAPGGVKFGNGVTVIDAKTLKMTQAVETLDAPHHMQVLDDRFVMADAWGVKQVLFTLDTREGNKLTRELAADPFKGRPYIGFPTPDGKYIYMTVRPEPNSGEHDAWISKVDTATWSVEKVVNVGPGAVWTTFTRDGQFAYVTIGEEDWVMKVDLAQKKVVGKTATGRGPYGGVLSPDETRLYVVSKGEGGRGQRGGTFVMIDTDAMRTLEERPSCLAFVCQADHALISPDGSELWIDNNMGYIDVFDLKTLDLKAEIATPFLADPHGGVWVQYDKDGHGHVVMDIGGPHGGVSPYLFDNQNGVPTLAQALSKGWGAAKSSSALALGATAKPAGGQAVSASSPSTTVSLAMEDFRFEPKELSVTTGSQVLFQIANNGQAIHNITSDAAGIKQFDVKANGKGEFTWTAGKPGTYKFVCTYHPGMEGTLTVK